MLRKLLRWVGVQRDTNVGAAAEQWAADWLRKNRGYSVVARNWRNPRDEREELDLVCRDGDVLVFVEVKARAAGALVPGYYAVNQRKKRVLARAAKAYLARLRPKPTTFRCDVVEVILPKTAGGAPEILHFENIGLFSPSFLG